MKTETILLIGGLIIATAVFMKRSDAQLEAQRESARLDREIALAQINNRDRANGGDETDFGDVVDYAKAAWRGIKGLWG